MKALKDIALEFTKMNYNTSDIETNPYYKGCLAGLISQEVTVDHMAKHIDELTERKDQLEEWLTEYRDQLKKENVYHKNQGIINAINELLNEND